MDEYYSTAQILSADANTTKVLRTDSGQPGKLAYITVLADSAHTIAFYDGVNNTGELICTKPASLAVGTYILNRALKNGLCAVVAASFAGNIVVSYR